MALRRGSADNPSRALCRPRRSAPETRDRTGTALAALAACRAPCDRRVACLSGTPRTPAASGPFRGAPGRGTPNTRAALASKGRAARALASWRGANSPSCRSCGRSCSYPLSCGRALPACRRRGRSGTSEGFRRNDSRGSPSTANSGVSPRARHPSTLGDSWRRPHRSARNVRAVWARTRRARPPR